jgi:hypothetical protein
LFARIVFIHEFEFVLAKMEVSCYCLLEVFYVEALASVRHASHQLNWNVFYLLNWNVFCLPVFLKVQAAIAGLGPAVLRPNDFSTRRENRATARQRA